MKKYFASAYVWIFITLSIASVLHFCSYILEVPIPSSVLLSSRLLFIAALIWLALKRKSLTTWILISMVIGAEIGNDLPAFAVNLQIFSKIFLRMIKTIIAPLLFATLVVGIAGHSDLKQVGRMGWKSILYFEVVSTIALFIGLAAINISQAGVGITLPPVAGEHLDEVKKQTIQEVILHIFPENLARAVYEGQVLQIVVFSILFGIAVAMLKENYKRPMIRFSESLAETMFKFTNLIMLFAPIAVGAAIAYTVGHMGLGVLVNLFKLLITLYVALIAFMLFVLLPVAYFLRIPVKRFIKAVAEPATIAFATTSSESALPRAMENMEAFGVPRKIVAFVLPTGYSFNLDGTTLYLALASIFVAQAAGIHLSFGQQVVMMFTLMLTSKGVAGVPRASLVILLGTAVSFGLPVEPIFIILGIDELMDMARTSVNVIGNCLASAVVARWEGELDTSNALVTGGDGQSDSVS
ncbi:MAG: sodium:dicarboxylate symporter [Bacteroidetes bacterium GWF2_42_66]|nr:MAG: sodium:dicarboxylate symporter [Bacteroidetes bacterium GWA2_42_15]OFY03317.1 MAG: sodium:dicarboxylate symporter [Bacteroidetes bacterium GWE2_42_39]OFY45729.1 MAG: sodium:dicarboxylate symporter [Bacteroidetes bacterium GWF2_42_66]HBL77311.1 dicarboxylate/amino acid:cation symporter [Prolixibacteraceae bacterium]HCR91946.1 dicarboxylate/amino acid:cation symporter [Prolixibacteraceae bacterium]